MKACAVLAAWTLASAGAIAHGQPVHYDISVQIEPTARRLEGAARIAVAAPGATTIALGRSFVVESIRVDGAPRATRGVERGDQQVWPVPAGRHTLEIRWHGLLAPTATSLDHRQTTGRTVATTGPSGTFLPAGSGWYPAVGNLLGSYRVTADLPAGQRGVVPGRLVQETLADGRARSVFEFAHPAEGIDLMAGPYEVETRMFRTARGSEIALRTYFHPEIAQLSAGYLDSVQGYLNLYEAWIGLYPFTEFSVVSSPTPTGFGMPTLTYLGVSVLRLPFIRATSLGHEVLHNWWGNGVYPDFAQGNWSEGLTTFMADYAYKEQAGAEGAREMRLGWLRDLAAVPPGEGQPLTAFTSRTHGTSQIVGYEKAAMLFFVLRDTIGTATLDRALRRFWAGQKFRVASWHDLQRACEEESGRDLAPFFAQWLDREGLPAVRIAEASRARTGGAEIVRLTLEQGHPAYTLRLPLHVRTDSGIEIHIVELTRVRQSFEIRVGARPRELALDPDFRVLRRLAEAELPPILRQTMVAPSVVVALAVPDARWSTNVRRLAERVLDAAPVYVSDAASPSRGTALLVVGRHTEVDAYLARNGLPPRPTQLAGDGAARVWAATLPGGTPLLVVSADSADALETVARLAPHYGRQSYLVFGDGRVIARGTWPNTGARWKLD